MGKQLDSAVRREPGDLGPALLRRLLAESSTLDRRGRGSSGGGIQPPIEGLPASWSCQKRAQRVEQNGSPFLTAISGRLSRQLAQRPSRRWGGSTDSEACSPNRMRVSSASFP
jgi:hypothetical protein